jgi:hydroxymethylbilane synthase
MTGSRTLRVATRRSALALAQSTQVGARLAELAGRPLELVEVVTAGDTDPSPLAQIGGTGVFVTAVRRAVVEGRADVAVHSLKDLPTAGDHRLDLVAVPERADPRDVLVSRAGGGLAELPAGARIGTGSPRRRAQLAFARPDLEVLDLRGNVDTRLARVLGGSDGATAPDLDAVVLAAAGLARLGRTGVISEYLDPEVMLPAPGQGALAVEVSAGSGLADTLRALDHPPTRAAVTAERSLLAALGVGCSAPVGALGAVDGADEPPTIRVRAVLATHGTLLRRSTTGPTASADRLGRDLAGALLADARTQERPTIDRGRPIR